MSPGTHTYTYSLPEEEHEFVTPGHERTWTRPDGKVESELVTITRTMDRLSEPDGIYARTAAGLGNIQSRALQELEAFRSMTGEGRLFSEFNKGAAFGRGVADAFRGLKDYLTPQDAGFIEKINIGMTKGAAAGSMLGWMPLLLSLADDVVATAQAKKSGQAKPAQAKPALEDDMVEVEIRVQTLYYGEYVEFGYVQVDGVWHPANGFIRRGVDLNNFAITQLGGSVQI